MIAEAGYYVSIWWRRIEFLPLVVHLWTRYSRVMAAANAIYV
jgi:hypothetical protein